jgi:3-oxoacyl-[acyl-carrier protein] reductase
MTGVGFDLSGQVVFITGAGGGLGRSIAGHFVAAGAFVACADLDADAVTETVAELGDASEPVVLDVRNRDAFLAAVAGVQARHGHVDVLCNVAGIAGNQSHVVDLTEAEFERVLAVNLKGVLFGCQAALRVMMPQGSGSIINMASSAIDVPRAGLAPYTMAKSAVAALTKVIAVEAGPSGVRVNAVAPGWVETPLARSSMTAADGTVDEDSLEQMMSHMRSLSPLGRLGQPSDVAYQFLYLASPAAAFITGQTLRPNGGASMPW